MVGKLDMEDLGQPCRCCWGKDEQIKRLKKENSQLVGRTGGLQRENNRLRKALDVQRTVTAGVVAALSEEEE